MVKNLYYLVALFMGAFVLPGPSADDWEFRHSLSATTPTGEWTARAEGEYYLRDDLDEFCISHKWRF